MAIQQETKAAAKNNKPKPEEIAALCVSSAEDRKAKDIVDLQLTEVSVIADYFVLCTGNSEPQLRGIAEGIRRDALEKLKVKPRSIEGTPASHWIILDFGSVVVHILNPEMRELYQIESLWGDAPKIDAVKKLEEVMAKAD